MRKVYGIVILIVVGACSLGAHAQVILSADFSTGQGYSSGPLLGQPASATNVWRDANEAVPADVFNVEDGTLSLMNTTTGARFVVITIPVQKGQFTMSWDWQYVGAADGYVDIGICLSDELNFMFDGNAVPGYNEQGTMIRMYTAGVVDIRDGDWDGGGTYSAENVWNYQDGKKFSIRMEVDAQGWTYDVYAKKEGDTTETGLAQGYGFRRLPTAETDGLNCLLIWDNIIDSQIGNGCILDNFVIYGPSRVSDWSVF